MNKNYFLLGLSLFVLTACSKEPMIRLSEARRAELEQKTTVQVLEDGDQAEVTFSKEAFVEADQTTSFNQVTEFLPIQPNTVLEGEATSLYMDYIDTQTASLQMYHQVNQEIKREFYSWDNQAIYYLGSQDSFSSPFNYLPSIPQGNHQTWLQFPIVKGNNWSTDGSSEATVTNIYQEAKIGDEVYQDLIEITYQVGDQTEVLYLARNRGLIAKEVNGQIVYLITQIREESFVRSDIVVYSPQEGSDPIKLSEMASSLEWQTNDGPGNVYTRLFRNLGWIDESISVNSVEIQDGRALVDFTPGIVGVLNTHPQTEKGLIPAIVATVGQSLQVDQVQLTVNGLGLLPDTLEYPVGGVWSVDSSWLEQ